MPNWRSEPNWPSPYELVDLNALLVAETGEPHGLLKPGELQAACAHPTNRWHYGRERDPTDLAVSLIVAVGRAHPFLQGNKRTAFAAGQLLLVGQGQLFHLPDTDASADVLRRTMTGEFEEFVLAEYFRPYLGPLDALAFP